MTKYSVLFKDVAEISDNDRADIARLYLSYFDGSDEAQVFSDLDEKT